MSEWGREDFVGFEDLRAKRMLSYIIGRRNSAGETWSCRERFRTSVRRRSSPLNGERSPLSTLTLALTLTPTLTLNLTLTLTLASRGQLAMPPRRLTGSGVSLSQDGRLPSERQGGHRENGPVACGRRPSRAVGECSRLDPTPGSLQAECRAGGHVFTQTPSRVAPPVGRLQLPLTYLLTRLP